MPGTDDFSTSIPMEMLSRLLALGRHYGFDPLCSAEMESYFSSLIARHTIEELENSIIPQSFLCVQNKPSWLQGSEWPVSAGEPMVFLGQFDAPVNEHIQGKLSVYVFCGRTVPTIQTITQRVGYVP